MIQLESELHPLKKLSLQDFSYSRLSTFTDCELKYFYSYILKEPREFGAPATLGNIIHQALEFTLESNEKLNLFDLLDNYKNSRPDYDPEEKIPEELIYDGEEMLKEFFDRHKDEKFDIVAKEMPFSVVIDNGRFNGYIDLVWKDEKGNVKCCDFKSGKQEVAAKNVPDNLQLGLYALILQYLYPEQDGVYAELYYLRSGRRKGHLFSAGDLSQIEIKLSSLVQEVLDKDDFKPVQDESKCYWCDYAKNGVCPTGSKRRNKSRY
jgi:ATP-dependent helicase/DNAse subunit B